MNVHVRCTNGHVHCTCMEGEEGQRESDQRKNTCPCPCKKHEKVETWTETEKDVFAAFAVGFTIDNGSARVRVRVGV